MIGMLVGAGIGAVSSIGKYFSGRSAQKEQEELMRRLQQQLGIQEQEMQTLVDGYTRTLEEIGDQDIYDMEEAFASLYEGVIQPMERDFDENVLPGIQAAYAGGIMGSGSALSGAQASAESSARRDLSENKASLRFQERGKAIDRNMQQQRTDLSIASQGFNASAMMPQLRMNNAKAMAGMESDTIASALTNQQGLWDAPGNVLKGALAGNSVESSIRDSLASRKKLDDIVGLGGPEIRTPTKSRNFNFEDYIN